MAGPKKDVKKRNYKQQHATKQNLQDQEVAPSIQARLPEYKNC